MFTLKPHQIFLTFLTIFLLLSPFTCSDPTEDEEIDELIALDEAEDELSQGNAKPSEAEALSRAQRIVVELNNDNTKKLLDENEFVLVLGYAPWCPRSAELMPRFAEAATALKEIGNPVVLAKIDAERFSIAASALEIKGFPTLLLFVNATPSPYTGGFTSEEIVIWTRKKTGMPVIRVNSVSEAEEFHKKHHMYAVGLFEKFEGPEYEEFVKAASSDDEIQFVETDSVKLANVLYPDIEPSTRRFFGLVKSEVEKYTAFEDTFKAEDIIDFLTNNKFPLVTIMTELNSARVYSSPTKLQVYVFAEAGELYKLLEPFQNVARKFKSQIMFVFVDIKEENLAKPFLTLFGLEETEDTVVAAFDYKISVKYLLESDPTPPKIEEFCSGILSGALSTYYKSHPIPDNKEASVLTIVGKTFDELVLSSPKNVLLEVHTPWCFKCDETSKQVEKLAKHFKGLENLVFARIDGSANEHPQLQVDDYPALLFYREGLKSNPMKLPTKANLKELAKLINKNIKAQQYHITREEL